MEKSNSSKVIAVVALVIGVLGLSIGFAAYTSVLNISGNANVEIGAAAWDVGFADTTGNMAPLTGTPTSISGTGVTSAGTMNMLKYTLSQGTAATLTNTNGSSVTYAFKIKNAGTIPATLKSITSAGISCAYNSTAPDRVIEQDATPNTGKTITAETGDIAAADCSAMFNVTLTINSTDYNLKNLTGATFSGTIPAGQAVDASLTIAATGAATTNVIDGDFVVTLGATTVNYASK